MKIIFFLAALPAVSSSWTLAFDLQAGENWLAGRNYGNEFVGGSAWALVALNAQNSNSETQTQIAGLLQTDLANNASWSWAEADLPGIEAWALEKTGQAQGIDATAITESLLALKGPNGGFKGLFECVANCTDPDWTKQVWQPVETTTDTALALMALKSMGTLDDQTKNNGLSFIYSLQNSDGSFRQTPSEQETQLYSLGPDLLSTTSLAVIAMQENGAGSTDQASRAKEFLKTQARGCFGDSRKVYGPAIASIAFAESGLADFASSAAEYAVLNQNADGGFADPLRSASASNTIDTGAAIFAAKGIQNKGACAPLSGSLSFNSQILPGNTQHFAATVEGAINTAILMITMPNGNLIQQDMSRVNDTFYQADFTQTQSTGSYAALLQLTPKYGQQFAQSSVFQVASTATPTPTATPAATPYPTPIIIQQGQQPAPQVQFYVPTTPATDNVDIESQLSELQTKLDQTQIELRNAMENNRRQAAAQSDSASGMTGLASAQTKPLFALSADDRAIALSFNPLLFILFAVLIVVAVMYRRWTRLRLKAGGVK